MAQITDPISAVAGYVAYSLNGTVWVDISGVGNKVTPAESTRMNGVAYTFDGDTGLITYGKREPFEVRVQMVYSEANAALAALAALHEAPGGTAVYLRWIPAGNTAGKMQYTTPSCKISAWNYPTQEAESGDPIMFEFAVMTPSLTRAAVAT